MKIKKSILLVFFILFLNSLEMLYQGSFFIGVKASYSYIAYVLIFIIPVLFYMKHLKEKQCLLICTFMIYLLFQSVNSYFTGSEISYLLVVFIAILACILIYIVSENAKIEELFISIRYLFYANIIFLIITDVCSIILLKKSQHVILSNELPIITITAALLILEDKGNKKNVFLCLTLYVFWIIFSVLQFTSDYRFQMKAVLMTATLMVIFFTLWTFTSIFKIKAFKKTRKYFYIYSFIIFTLFTFVFSLYYFNKDFSERDVSLGLRIAVAISQINDYNSGSIFNQFFGYGLGSSMKEYSVYYLNYSESLRSHSGFMSLIYEHGLFFIAFLIYVIFVTLRFKRIPSKGANFGIHQILLFLLVCTLIVLNVIYLIAVPVPNFVHQSQFVIVIMLIVYIKRKIIEFK